MLKIKAIQLKNFQYHEDLFLEFHDDLNVITGATGSGKTCIFRALGWLMSMNNISESDYRREGSKETSVKVWLNNGFQVEKVRSNTLNRYILSSEGAEDKVFDSVGRDMPEEIKSVFGFDNIEIDKEKINLNFADQDQMNFLMDSSYSDTFKAQLFNKLTGNELLDKIFKNLNKEALSFSRELKDKEEQIKKQEEELVDLSTKYKECKEKVTYVTKTLHDLEDKEKIYNALKVLAEELSQNEQAQTDVREKSKQIKIISEDKIKESKDKAILLEELNALKNNLDDLNKKIKECENTKIKILDIDFEELKKKNTQIQELTKNQTNLQNINTQTQELRQKMKQLDNTIASDEKELKEIWKSTKICPLCGKNNDRL